jgi:hypothetical protein
MATLTFNRQKFETLLSSALEEAADELAIAFETTIESSIFAWPNQTKRANGSTVGSPRNKVDTRRFLNSQSHTLINPVLVRFVWDVEYALIILYGYTTTAGNTYPGSDWINETIQQFSPLDLFVDALRRHF